MRSRLLRDVGKCICGGLLLTALSNFFDQSGGELSPVGEFLLVPGMIINGWLELLGTLFISGTDDYFMFPSVSMLIISVMFYSALFLGLVSLVRDIRSGEPNHP
jgi:hypothetical protein